MINTEWCSLCLAKPGIGEATVDDGTGVLMKIALCEDCIKKLTPPGENYSIGW